MDTPVRLVSPSRREFCTFACQFASAVAAGTLAGCGGDSPTGPSAPSLTAVSATVAGRTLSVTVDGSSPLASVGSAAIVQSSLGAFLLGHTGQDSYTALTATCTHESCTVSGFDSGQYVCPCHGSRFSTSGAVARGPAGRPLQQFPTQVAGNVVSFTV